MQKLHNLKTQIAADIAVEKNSDPAHVFLQTWSDLRNETSFKLTGYGFFELKQKLQYWTVPLKKDLRSLDLLRLHRIMQKPWFLDRHGLHFFDHEVAVQLMLYDNDVVFWLEAQHSAVDDC